MDFTGFYFRSEPYEKLTSGGEPDTYSRLGGAEHRPVPPATSVYLVNEKTGGGGGGGDDNERTPAQQLHHRTAIRRKSSGGGVSRTAYKPSGGDADYIEIGAGDLVNSWSRTIRFENGNLKGAPHHDRPSTSAGAVTSRPRSAHGRRSSRYRVHFVTLYFFLNKQLFKD